MRHSVFGVISLPSRLHSLLQQISHDLRVTLAPRHSEILQILLSILPKSLSAPTFTVLLETLSSFIKYVTTPLDLVEDTWKAFQIQLPKCNPEVQRAVAELWGTIIRRLKLPIREKCSIAMVENPDVDISAWIFVSACKVGGAYLCSRGALILTLPSLAVGFAHAAHNHTHNIQTLTQVLSIRRKPRRCVHGPSSIAHLSRPPLLYIRTILSLDRRASGGIVLTSNEF